MTTKYAEPSKSAAIETTNGDSGPEYHDFFEPDESPQKPPSSVLLADGHPPTDGGNAERMVAKYGDRMAYIQELGWLAYDGKRFVPDCLGILEAYAKRTVMSMYGSIPVVATTDSERKALAAWATKSDNHNRIKAMIESARSVSGISARPEDFDAFGNMINTPNAVIDLATGDITEHAPGWRFTKMTKARYDNEARAPKWRQFLLDVMGGDESMVEFIQRAVGYSATASTKEQVWFLLHGKGANGKSTFLSILQRVLGDYFQNTDPKVFLQNNRDGPSPEIARLRGARFIAATEPEEHRKLAEGFIKQWTGGDTITARHLRREPIEFKPIGKVWLSANHLPLIRPDSHANWRRVRPIPFRVEFTEDAQKIARSDGIGVRPMHKGLENEIVDQESPGVMAWIVEGAIKCLRDGLGAPPQVLAALEDYKREMDPLADFLEACCEFGEKAECSKKEFYDAYVMWCKASGADPISKRGVGLNLAGRGVITTNNGKRGNLGVTLNEQGSRYADDFSRLAESKREDFQRTL